MGVVEGRVFAFSVLSLILANAVLIAVSSDFLIRDAVADWDAKNGKSGTALSPAWLRTADTVFTAIFFIELCLRLLALEGEFFTNRDRVWNVADLVLVSISVVDSAVLELSSSPSIVRMLKLLRMGRSARTMRVLRYMPFLYKLRFLVLACINSFSALFWALVVLSLLTYIFSVVLVNSLVSHVEEAAEDSVIVEEIRTYFGDLPTSMLTLFMSITGGVNWVVIVDIFREVSVFMVLFYLLFFIFSSLAVMNVITSIFVSDAVEVANQDRDIKMRAELVKSRRQLAILTEIFTEMDSASSGMISREQFEVQMQREDIVAMFHLFDLDVLDAISFFELLDADRSGGVDVEEFVMGCLRMRGHSNMVDMEISVQEIKRMTRDTLMMQRALSVHMGAEVSRCLGFGSSELGTLHE